MWFTVAFGVDVRALLCSIAAGQATVIAIGVLGEERKLHAMSALQVAHGRVLAGDADLHHRSVVLVELELDLATEDTLRDVKERQSLRPQTEPASYHLSLWGRVAGGVLFLGSAYDREA